MNPYRNKTRKGLKNKGKSPEPLWNRAFLYGADNGNRMWMKKPFSR